MWAQGAAREGGRFGFLLGFFILVGGAIPSQAFFDTFDIGSPPTRFDDAADPNDLAWWVRNSSKQTLSIVADTGTPGIGSGNALNVNMGAQDLPTIGNGFGSITLGPSVGDSLTLSFDVRFLTTQNATFRFGFANSNGTPVTGDNQTNSVNDIGYYGQFAIKNPETFQFPTGVFRDKGTDSTGQVWFGNDVTNLTTFVSPILIPDPGFQPHAVDFTITRTASGVALQLKFDGVIRATGADTNAIITTFDEVAFLNENKTIDYRLDNVRLGSVVQPNLSITKAGNPNPVCPGGALTYSIIVSNGGTAVATGVVVQDPLPPQTALVSATPAYTGTTNLSFALGALAVGGSTNITIVVNVATNATGALTNTAAVFGSTPSGTNTATTITIVRSPPSCLISGPSSVCVATTTNFTAPAGMVAYNWAIAGDGTISGATNAQTVAVNATSAGSFTLSLGVTDTNGCSSVCQQIVTVINAGAPLLVCPTDRQLQCGDSPATNNTGEATATGNCGGGTATVTFEDVATPANCTGLAGIDRVWTAMNLSGQTSICTQHITFVDNSAPSIACPADKILNADPGSCTASNVSLGAPIVGDNCGGAVTVTNNAPEVFSSGTTVVVWTATDDCGNSAICTQSVTIVDNQPPTIECPVAVTNSTDAGFCYATEVALGAPVTGDNCAVSMVTNDAPAQFPVGDTTVNWIVVDSSGHSNTCGQTVTILDTQLPAISCPSPVVTNVDFGPCDVILDLGLPFADDNCGVVSITNTAPAGFPAGTNLVVWTVTDTGGNQRSCTQEVIVVKAPPIPCYRVRDYDAMLTFAGCEPATGSGEHLWSGQLIFSGDQWDTTTERTSWLNTGGLQMDQDVILSYQGCLRRLTLYYTDPNNQTYDNILWTGLETNIDVNVYHKDGGCATNSQVILDPCPCSGCVSGELADPVLKSIYHLKFTCASTNTVYETNVEIDGNGNGACGWVDAGNNFLIGVSCAGMERTFTFISQCFSDLTVTQSIPVGTYAVIQDADCCGVAGTGTLEITEPCAMTPTFAGLDTATPEVEGATLSWPAASPSTVTYKVYQGTASGAENLAAPVATTTNLTVFIDSLDPGCNPANTYYFVVRASDECGGAESNLVEKSVQPMLDPNADQDADGMSNGFESDFGLDPCNPSDANLDPDNDGMSNLEEALAGTNPNSHASALQIIAITKEGNDVRITWTCGARRTNVVQITSGTTGGSFSNNFADLNPQIILDIAPSLVTTNYLHIGAGSTNLPALYYRVRLVP